MSCEIAYYNTIGDRWDRNSDFNWELDLSWISHPDGGVTIKKGWAQHQDYPHVLVCKTAYNDSSVTALFNVKWRYYGESEFKGPYALP